MVKPSKSVKVANLKQKRVKDILDKIDADDFLNKKKQKLEVDDSGSLDDIMDDMNDDDDYGGDDGGEDDFYLQNKEK